MRTWIRWWAASALAGALLLGCSRDPNVRKQKYFESGAQYFQAQKYREVATPYQHNIGGYLWIGPEKRGVIGM